MSYEEELFLGDKVVAAKNNPDDKKLQREGEEALWKIVQAYTPMIIADTVRAIGKNRYLYVDRNDIVADAQLEAMNVGRSFNPRGIDGRKGRRFSSYARLAIRRRIMASIATAGTPFTAPVSAIKRDLSDYMEHGGPGGIRGGHIAGYHDMSDIDDHESSVVSANNTDDIHDTETDKEVYGMCRDVLREDIANVIITTLHDNTVDSRDIGEECGVTTNFVNRCIKTSGEIFMHPSIRMRMLDSILKEK